MSIFTAKHVAFFSSPPPSTPDLKCFFHAINMRQNYGANKQTLCKYIVSRS